MRRWILLGLSLVTAPAGLAGQTSAMQHRAAASITPEDVAHRVGVIADDSMLGRDTPSRGLELTAQYVAEQFRRFGLRPGGDQGSWFQRYPINRKRLLLGQSAVVFSAGSIVDSVDFTSGARYDGGGIPGQPVSGPAVLVSGALTGTSAGALAVRDKIALYVPATNADQGLIQQIIRALYLGKPRALLILNDADSAGFAVTLPRRAPERTIVGFPPAQPPAIQVRAGAIRPSLTAAGIEVGGIRNSGKPILRELPGLGIVVQLRDSVISSISAPNTVGILEGTDPELKHQYLVYSAHMDHIGISPGRPDSINNGADDDGSGTVGVIELAEAFSQTDARPRRSVIFLTVSGEEKGLWGSDVFTSRPPVPIKHIVADINIDMIGRNWRDTIVAIGKEHSDLGATLERVNRAHRELGMTAIDDRWPEERFYFRSDHYNFARRGVPVLFFFNGVHADYHEVTDSPDKIDSEKESRILKLLFYLGEEIGNTPHRPVWNPESYKEIVE
jgi:peptidase M28-like protein